MIYAQHISGKYRTIKNRVSALLLLLYFFAPWLRWDRGEGAPNQAILMEIENRRAFFFGIEIWPQELYYLTGILIIAAFGLFFATSLFGRVWCGYTCPHTVYVDLFTKVEAYFQGDRNARIKLDEQPMNSEKFRKKFLTHATWLFLGFMFAFGWVCYFYDAPTLLAHVLSTSVTSGGLTWLVALTITTYIFGGFLREKVCYYMCPYGRFQSAMLDDETTIVTYNSWRGEPRGNSEGSGDCINCNKCVVVCPMGVDIREGLQIGCIGCGLCIDACDSVMEKLNRPLGLIGYESNKSVAAKKSGLNYARKWISLKIVMFSGVIITASTLLMYALLTKSDIVFTALHDRNKLFVTLPDGSIRNAYTLKIANKRLTNRELLLSTTGLTDATFKMQGSEIDYRTSDNFTLMPQEEREIIVYVKSGSAGHAREELNFVLTDVQNGEEFIIQSMFIRG